MTRPRSVAAFAALFTAVSASVVARQTAAPTASVSEPSVTAISQCSAIQETQICLFGTTKFRILSTPTGTLPSAYTGCHEHDALETYCFYAGGEVQIQPATAAVTSPAPSTAHDHDAAPSVTVISECHGHESSVFCKVGTTEYEVHTTVTATSDIPPTFTGCHAHGSELFCLGPSGDDVEVHVAGEEHDDDTANEPAGRNCHFHAGVEHCTGSDGDAAGAASCEKVQRDYNIPLRIGLLFVILATSAIGVFSPIFLVKILPAKTHVVFTILRQFGTGVIISTAFVHLYTHATLMFANPCLGELEYEGTASAILMAGLLISFLVEYIGKRVVQSRIASSPTIPSKMSPETVSILVLEAGIIFHSILIGVTLVVAGDSFFLTLFVVILFHQMFEGIALGTRIAGLGEHKLSEKPDRQAVSADARPTSLSHDASGGSMTDSMNTPPFSLTKKLLLAAIFAFVTPVGMAIGIGVLQKFNGNDRNTIIAIGTLDALSAGILVWVGVVEMWAEDWMLGSHAELANTGVITTVLAGLGLVSGMVLMSVLGKWA